MSRSRSFTLSAARQATQRDARVSEMSRGRYSTPFPSSSLPLPTRRTEATLPATAAQVGLRGRGGGRRWCGFRRCHENGALRRVARARLGVRPIVSPMSSLVPPPRHSACSRPLTDTTGTVGGRTTGETSSSSSSSPCTIRLPACVHPPVSRRQHMRTHTDASTARARALTCCCCVACTALGALAALAATAAVPADPADPADPVDPADAADAAGAAAGAGAGAGAGSSSSLSSPATIRGGAPRPAMLRRRAKGFASGRF